MTEENGSQQKQQQQIESARLLDLESPRDPPKYFSHQNIMTSPSSKDAHLLDRVINRPLNKPELKDYNEKKRRSYNQYIEQFIQQQPDSNISHQPK